MLSLDGLVIFGGDDLAQFVPCVFNLRPGQLDRWSAVSILLGAEHAAEQLNLLEHFGGETGAAFFDSF
mgnify:CR=1 FL=1